MHVELVNGATVNDLIDNLNKAISDYDSMNSEVQLHGRLFKRDKKNVGWSQVIVVRERLIIKKISELKPLPVKKRRRRLDHD